MLWVVVVAWLITPLRAAYRWWRRGQIDTWPVASGVITSAVATTPEKSFFRQNSRSDFIAEILYSYSVGGETFTGKYVQDVYTESEALEFVRDLDGRSVNVRYQLNAPSKSVLTESEVNGLLAARTPTFTGAAPPPPPPAGVPAWILWIPAALALFAFVASAALQIRALLGYPMPADSWFFAMHAGIFVVFIPAVMVTTKRVGNAQRKDLWKVALRGTPDWMRYLLYALLAYTFVTFFSGWLAGFSGARHAEPNSTPWSMFAGNWMVFYYASFCLLYAAIRAENSALKCMQGHNLPPGAQFCPHCGQPSRFTA
jgi:hypothetical protein